MVKYSVHFKGRLIPDDSYEEAVVRARDLRSVLWAHSIEDGEAEIVREPHRRETLWDCGMGLAVLPFLLAPFGLITWFMDLYDISLLCFWVACGIALIAVSLLTASNMITPRRKDKEGA